MIMQKTLEYIAVFDFGVQRVTAQVFENSPILGTGNTTKRTGTVGTNIDITLPVVAIIIAPVAAVILSPGASSVKID